MIRVLLILATFLAAAPAMAARHALVFGNGAYQSLDVLRNAPNDASDLANKLAAQGFRVTMGIDLDRTTMLTAVQNFSQSLQPGDTALFFFAGHGMQIGQDNYIMPVNAEDTNLDALQASSIRLQSVISSLESRASTRIIILDACRNNPFPTSDTVSRSSSVSRGFLKLDAGVGSFIAFSTAPGAVADDGTGRNSPFTEALLRHMDRGGENIHAVMRRVRADVMQSTSNRQIPWENSALIDEVFLSARPAAIAQTAQPLVQPQSQPLAQAPAQPQAQPQIQAPTLQFQASHQVRGLDPNGDGFLALRTGASTQFPMTMMLTEGTPLSVQATNGRWYLVRTPEGMEGWAHSNWIVPVPSAAPLTRQPRVQTAAPAPAPQSCDQLWYQRNAIFAARGYCFQSARGQAAFSNAGCLQGVPAGDIPLTTAERAQVSALRAQEQAMGCR